MYRKKGEGEDYINAFPRLKKWINECVCCHAKGYKPEMPDVIVEGCLDVYFVKKYFKPLEINKDGLCKVCEKLQNNQNTTENKPKNEQPK